MDQPKRHVKRVLKDTIARLLRLVRIQTVPADSIARKAQQTIRLIHALLVPTTIQRHKPLYPAKKNVLSVLRHSIVLSSP
jgi:hypothetical protein